MASKYDYKLVNNDPSLKVAISELRQKIEHNALLAVDCEGVDLSRKGTLTIITVATEEKVYIFDVLELGKRATVRSGLREILDNNSCTKLMFDCRQDSDALWHQLNVRLTGVLDLQLLEILYRRENDTANSHELSRTRHKTRSQRTDEVESIYGFRRCLELYLKDEDLLKMKDEGSKLLKRDTEVWEKRPLPDKLIQYCIVDTMAMFRLYENMKDVEEREGARLRVATEKYVDLYRSKTTRSFDDFETNALLPLDIIPDEGTLSFPPADTKCTRCKRLFPREEFTKTQLKNNEQKCRVCKEIKRRADVRRKREANSQDDFLYRV